MHDQFSITLTWSIICQAYEASAKQCNYARPHLQINALLLCPWLFVTISWVKYERFLAHHLGPATCWKTCQNLFSARLNLRWLFRDENQHPSSSWPTAWNIFWWFQPSAFLVVTCSYALMTKAYIFQSFKVMHKGYWVLCTLKSNPPLKNEVCMSTPHFPSVCLKTQYTCFVHDGARHFRTCCLTGRSCTHPKA